MRTGTGRTKYGHKREGNTGHGEHRSDITPPSRTVRDTIQRGGGVGALEASRDTETGQDRRPPGGARSGTHGGAGSSGGHGGSGAREATANRGARAAMAEQGIQEAMAGPPPRPRPQAPAPSPQLELYNPPPKKFLGESRGSIRHLGALWRHGHLGALWRRMHS